MEQAMNDETHVLTWSTNAGRYCFDDPEHGADVTSGERLAIEVLNGLWVEGTVEHSSGNYEVGCYTIANTGRARRQAQPNPPQTGVEVKAAVYGAMEEGASLEEAIKSVSPQTADVFFGYFFISRDHQVLGLCTSMRVRRL
jgi:hypothetical protein